MESVSLQPRRWTRAEYEHLIELGFFHDERLELLDGEIVVMTPQKSAHATAILKGHAALAAAFGPGHTIRPQLPLALDAMSEPEPDLTVVPGTPDDYPTHPQSALLVVEVADSTLRSDRQRKGALYAQAGLSDFWIVNLIDRVVEVYREPVQSPDGWHYRLIRAHTPDEVIVPLARPDAGIPVAALLPKAP